MSIYILANLVRSHGPFEEIEGREESQLTLDMGLSR